MDININYLKTFKALAEIKNFTRTAEKLNMTQPGVSQHIKWLESYFNTPLLSKNGKKFDLTVEGKKIYEYTEELFKGHQIFLDSLLEDEPHKGSCNLASPGSFGIKMYDFLLEYSVKHNELFINYSYAPNDSIERDILSDDLEMGFMSNIPRDDSLKRYPIDKEKLCLIVPAGNQIKTYSDLKKLGFIHHPDGPSMAHKLLSLNYPKEFKGIDEIPVHGSINQITRILEPVALGLGFTVLPEYACKAFHNQKAIQYIKLPKEIESTIYAVSKKFKILPTRYTEILKAFQKYH